jgi:hypothetical protein
MTVILRNANLDTFEYLPFDDLTANPFNGAGNNDQSYVKSLHTSFVDGTFGA